MLLKAKGTLDKRLAEQGVDVQWTEFPGALQLQEGRQQEAGITYQKTVLSAWHEVDDALVAYQANQRRRDSLQQAVMHSQHALDSVHQQYAQGTVDFLNVLTVQNTLLANEAALVDSTVQVSLSLRYAAPNWPSLDSVR